jgi:hypothetical protein
MALMRQRFPTHSVQALKAMAMNGASADIFTEDANVGLRHGPARMGAGRANVPNALTTPTHAFADEDPDGVSVVFDGEVVGTVTRRKRVRVVNTGAAPQTYDIAIDTITDMAGVAFSAPASVVVPGNGAATFDVTMTANASQIKRGRDPAAALLDISGDSRPWLTEESGLIELSQAGVTKLKVPVYASVRPAGLLGTSGTVGTAAPPAANGAATIALLGTGVCTGALAGTACTTSPASPTAANPNVDFTSMTFAFELHHVNPRNPAMLPEANARYVGVSFDGTSLRFGVATWGGRVSPRDVVYWVLLDNDMNGVDDWHLVNGFWAAVGSQPSDTSLTIFRTAPNGSFASGSYLNGWPAFQYDTGLFGSDVMVHTIGPGLIGNPTAFRYRVQMCDRNSVCETLGPFTYNRNAQGMNFGTSAAVLSQPGGTIPVTWNAANIAANGSKGILLLHAHNAAGTRAEHVRMPSTTSLATSAPSVPEGSTVTLTATVAGINVSGTVQFREGDAVVSGCGAVAIVAGQAQCTTPALEFGTYTFTAQYAGDGVNAPSAATVAQAVTAPATGCSGFADLPATSPFCASVDWMANRLVTTGCGGGNYCPTPDVPRIGMAAFMFRLGTALVPVARTHAQASGPVVLDTQPRVCDTGAISVAGYAATVGVDAILRTSASTSVELRATLVESLDGGTTWQPVNAQSVQVTVPAGRWINARLLGDRASVPGEVVRFAVALSRVGLGSGDLAEARCELRAILDNRNPTHAPFDPAP